MMPLKLAKLGEINYIRKISGKDEVRQRLAELGLVVGEEVTVVSEICGNIIVSVKGSRIALDDGMAGRIMV
ncbi:MAG: ferrous iron transport protein A [Clostridiales bacterium]|jgi:ferrous iron transport protein A|nr:ferrous iron transport protein A [Clostridiales bacterium]